VEIIVHTCQSCQSCARCCATGVQYVYLWQ